MDKYGKKRTGSETEKEEYYAPYPASRGRRKKSSNYAFLFAVIIFAGVIVCVSAFALTFSSFAGKTGKQPQQTIKPTTGPAATPFAGEIKDNKKEIKEICLLKSVDLAAKTLVLYNIEGNETYTKTASGSTEMKDKYGAGLVLAEFKPGDIVEVVYSEDDSELKSIRQSPQAQTFSNLTNLVIDTTAQTITLGNNVYNYNEELICRYKGEPIDLKKIDKIDTLTLRVFKTAALYLEVVAGHGTIEVLFNENILNATLEIDNNVYTALNGTKSYSVSEGTHRVIVKAGNIETYTRDIVVVGGQTVAIDLSDVQIKAGVMSFKSDVEDVRLTVNGQVVPISSFMVFDYGEYVIKATKDGYETFEETVVFNQPTYEVEIIMTPVPTPTPRPERPDTLRVTITTEPDNAFVYVDGLFVGLSPVTVTLELGSHEISMERSGYQKIVQVITLTTGMQPPVFNFTMSLQSNVQIPGE